MRRYTSYRASLSSALSISTHRPARRHWIGGQRGCEGQHHGIGSEECPRALHHHHDKLCRKGIDWVICGGESGPQARPMNPMWARSLKQQCEIAQVAFFMKQIDKKQPIPDYLMVRQFPAQAS